MGNGEKNLKLIPKQREKLIFGFVGLATNFESSLEPCSRTMSLVPDSKICAASLPNSQLFKLFGYVAKLGGDMQGIIIESKLPYFNEELGKSVFLYLGNEKNVEYSPYSFAKYGVEIGFNLKNEMRSFLEGPIKEQLQVKDLLRRFESFCNLVRKVNAIAKDFRQKLATFAQDDKTTVGCARVMNRQDAEDVTKFLEDFVSKVVYDYLTCGTQIGVKLSTSMMDRAILLGPYANETITPFVL